jgi:hypothetical protein
MKQENCLLLCLIGFAVATSQMTGLLAGTRSCPAISESDANPFNKSTSRFASVVLKNWQFSS